MGLILSRQIESRISTLALLETIVMSNELSVDALLTHIQYFKIEKDVAKYIKSMVQSDAGVVVTLKENWKAMARTQVATFTADTAIDLMKETFVQNFQAQVQAAVSVSPTVGVGAVAERAKTFTDTFIDTLIDDVLKKSVSSAFWNVLYPSDVTTGPPKAPRDDHRDRTVTLKGSEAEVERLFKCLQT